MGTYNEYIAYGVHMLKFEQIHQFLKCGRIQNVVRDTGLFEQKKKKAKKGKGKSHGHEKT